MVDLSSWALLGKVSWTLSLRGRRSRNKVSVGEPAEGSFAHCISKPCEWFLWVCGTLDCLCITYSRAAVGLVACHLLFTTVKGVFNYQCIGNLNICAVCCSATKFHGQANFSNECLGSIDDEGCSQTWYSLWIAEIRELLGFERGVHLWDIPNGVLDSMPLGLHASWRVDLIVCGMQSMLNTHVLLYCILFTLTFIVLLWTEDVKHTLLWVPKLHSMAWI